jgi:hypothetical protein
MQFSRHRWTQLATQFLFRTVRNLLCSLHLQQELWKKSWIWLVVLGDCRFRLNGSFLVMKLLTGLTDERAHGDSGLVVNFLPKRVGA